jgi:hypothetical protein
MKNKKFHTVRTVPKSNRKIVDRGKMYTPNTKTWPLTFLAECLIVVRCKQYIIDTLYINIQSEVWKTSDLTLIHYFKV